MEKSCVSEEGRARPCPHRGRRPRRSPAPIEHLLLRAPAHPPSQLALNNSPAPTCPADQPRARPQARPRSDSRTERSRAAVEEALPCRDEPTPRATRSLGLFHRVCSQFTSLASAQNGCTQRRKGGFCSIQTGSNGWTGKATLLGLRCLIPTEVSHSSCAGTGRGDAALTAFPRNEGASATSCKGWCGKGGSG